MLKNERPTFYYKNKPVRASGILFYIIEDNKYIFLLRKVNNRWEDLGGKTDIKDKDYLETAVREATEETNNKLLDKDDSYNDCYYKIKGLVINDSKKIYIYNSKYLLYLVKLDNDIKNLSMTRFGLYEKHDNKDHYFRWICRLNNLHPRLPMRNILYKLKNNK